MAVTRVDIAQRTHLSAAHHCGLFIASLRNTFHLVSTSKMIQWTMNSKVLEGRCRNVTRSITGPSTCGLKKIGENKTGTFHTIYRYLRSVQVTSQKTGRNEGLPQ